MPRMYEFPRARGGRGPQVGPGTFEGRTATDPIKPVAPGAIMWSPGISLPDIELWAFRAGADYQTVSQTYPYLWLDAVPGAVGFQPPGGTPPDGQQTASAFESYAQARLADEYNIQALAWDLRLARPFPTQTVASPRKIAVGVYWVAQEDRSSGTIPMAWVWVTDNGSREIWLYYRPGELGGFQHVGTVPEGQVIPYTSSLLHFHAFNPSYYSDWYITLYSESLEKFKDLAMSTPDSPASSRQDLVVHDYRIDELPLLP